MPILSWQKRANIGIVIRTYPAIDTHLHFQLGAHLVRCLSAASQNINAHAAKGKYNRYQIQSDSIYVDGDYQWGLTQLGTLALGNDVVTIIVSNHQPEDQSFAAEYRLLVSTGTAKK